MNLAAAESLAYQLMDQHGLFKEGWHFRWNRGKVTYGVCHHGERTIYLSKPLTEVGTEETVRDTILHEIAHALAGRAAGHGRQWKLKAAEIGARPQRCASEKSTVAHLAPYTGTCRDCGAKLPRFRRPSLGMIISGAHIPCRGKANKGRIEWQHKTGEKLTLGMRDLEKLGGKQ